MERRTVIRCVLAIVMMIYIGFAVVYSHARASERTCRDVKVKVVDPARNGFITPAAVLGEIERLKLNPARTAERVLDLRAMEAALTACDNIESVNCVLLTDDTLRVEVQPLVPLARIFDRNDRDYFINRGGKEMVAKTHYRIDVPVVFGKFSESLKPTVVLPYLDYLAAHPDYDRLVSALEVTPRGDIIMIPAIRGHVVNLGDTADIDNKFRRLKAFYHQVLPVKGWTCYDTISVKWRSRIIASKRGYKRAADIPLQEEFSDIDDIETMKSEADSMSASAPRP